MEETEAEWNTCRGCDEPYADTDEFSRACCLCCITYCESCIGNGVQLRLKQCRQKDKCVGGVPDELDDDGVREGADQMCKCNPSVVKLRKKGCSYECEEDGKKHWVCSPCLAKPFNIDDTRVLQYVLREGSVKFEDIHAARDAWKGEVYASIRAARVKKIPDDAADSPQGESASCSQDSQASEKEEQEISDDSQDDDECDGDTLGDDNDLTGESKSSDSDSDEVSEEVESDSDEEESEASKPPKQTKKVIAQSESDDDSESSGSIPSEPTKKTSVPVVQAKSNKTSKESKGSMSVISPKADKKAALVAPVITKKDDKLREESRLVSSQATKKANTAQATNSNSKSKESKPDVPKAIKKARVEVESDEESCL